MERLGTEPTPFLEVGFALDTLTREYQKSDF